MQLLSKLAAVIATVLKREQEPSAFPYIYETDGPNKGRIRGEYRGGGGFRDDDHGVLHNLARWYDPQTRSLHDDTGECMWSNVPGKLQPVMVVSEQDDDFYTLQWVAS